MGTDFVRDTFATALIFGFFGMAWFGWAQEAPPQSWRKWLAAGSVLSFLTCLTGGILTYVHRADSTVFTGSTSRSFGIVVGIEFGLAAIGAVLLAVLKRTELTPVWIALVVGVHLFPVAHLLRYPMIHVVGALVTIAAVVAIPVARRRSLKPSAVVGPGAGVALVAGALFSLATAL
jgi:hypothetical protein